MPPARMLLNGSWRTLRGATSNSHTCPSFRRRASRTTRDYDGSPRSQRAAADTRSKRPNQRRDPGISDHAAGPKDGRDGRPMLIFQSYEVRHGKPLPQPLDQEVNTPCELSQGPDGTLLIDSKGVKSKVSPRWLRDVCACPECRHPDTAQRQVNVFRGGPQRTRIAEADLSQWPKQLKVRFADGHETVIPRSVLIGRRSLVTTAKREGIVGVESWSSRIPHDPPTGEYGAVMAGPGMETLLRDVRKYGFSFVENMPTEPKATQALLEAIGPIRNTHYGGFYDFTSDLSSKDTAYTSEALEPHTDNTYFTDPAGLQALHMLSHTDGTGGESSLVDGFHAAEQLFNEDPAAYRTLGTVGVYAHASGNEGISIQPAQAFPTFKHSEQYSKLVQVRWNNADRAGVATAWRHLDAWYEAAGKFDALLNDPKNQYWFQLKPGTMLLFDNWRVLHGRAAFTGKRRMCGGYISRDDFISKFKMTNYSKEELEGSTVTG